MHDLVIRNATIVDGRGGPAVEGTVAVDHGRISAVGPAADVGGRGRDEIDAGGALVTPGFVDVHTHYDGQVTWDPLLTPSIWHGVTTVVMGNCGVGFAPAAPDRHEFLIGLMEGVEDIPGAALVDGIRWDWESFPEYLDAVDRFPRAIDVGAQVAHGAVRAYVMDERGAANEPATADDIGRMAAIVGEAIAAGALGFTTNRLPLHRAVDGRPVPGTFAAEDELFAIGRAVRAASPTADVVYEVITAGSMGEDPDAYPREIDWMARLSGETGLPFTFALGQLMNRPELWRDLFALVEAANARGARLVPQVPCRPLGILLGLQTKHAFVGRPSYEALASLPVAERARRMADPEVRAGILAEQQAPGGTPLAGLIRQLVDFVFPLGDPPDYEPAAERSVGARARATGRPPEEVLYDLLLEQDGAALLLFTLGGYAHANLDWAHELLTRPDTVLGLGDGGAHVGLICDSSYPTLLLDFWTRARTRGDRLPVETAVRKLTSEPARLYGLDDRGVLAPGRRADLNVIDLDRLGLHQPEVVHDLPAGARRLIQRADGYVATVVAGDVVQREGADTGARPGRLIRGPQPAPR
jgi:N-acyl-D-aspartate/D-glutamate deacylase